MADPDITVHSTGTFGFAPVSYPQTGMVTQNDTITFQAYGDAPLTFYAQSGLFYFPINQTKKTNTGSTPFAAPGKSTGLFLTLTVAATPLQTTPYILSRSPVSQSGDESGDEDDDKRDTPSDGTINVGSKPTDDSMSVTDRRRRARQRHAPAPAMRTRGSD